MTALFWDCGRRSTVQKADGGLAGLIWLERVAPWDPARLPAADSERLVVAAAVQDGPRFVSDAGEISLRRGQAVLLPPGSDARRLLVDEPQSCAAAILRGKLLADALAPCIAEGRLLVPAGLSDVQEAVNACREADSCAERISAAAYQLLMRLRETARPCEQDSGYPLLVDAALGIMQEEFAHLSGPEEVAERLGVTAAHLTRLFSKTLGTTPGHYLRQCRLAYAKKLLLLPEFTVTLAAEMSGYSNANYFSKVFRRETGMSPAEFKKLNGADAPAGKSFALPDELYL